MCKLVIRSIKIVLLQKRDLLLFLYSNSSSSSSNGANVCGEEQCHRVFQMKWHHNFAPHSGGSTFMTHGGAFPSCSSKAFIDTPCSKFEGRTQSQKMGNKHTHTHPDSSRETQSDVLLKWRREGEEGGRGFKVGAGRGGSQPVGRVEDPKVGLGRKWGHGEKCLATAMLGLPSLRVATQ